MPRTTASRMALVRLLPHLLGWCAHTPQDFGDYNGTSSEMLKIARQLNVIQVCMRTTCGVFCLRARVHVRA